MPSDYDPKQVAVLDPSSLDEAVSRARAAFAAAGDLDQLTAARGAHLGGRSPVVQARGEIGALPPQARSDAGQRVNQALAAVKGAYDERREELEGERDSRALADERVDVTVLPGRLRPGFRHPLTLLVERVADVFLAMGWEVAEGPEVEQEWFNFDALNISKDHPARELQDTIWLDPPSGGLLMRTHTSPVQVRTLLDRGAPVHVVAPGRVFRNEALDATHSPVFHQVEGLCVDEGITMADLRGTLDRFAAEMFGAGLVTRLRPSYFPFTEPSAEVDVQCAACRGESARPGAPACRVCGSEGWIEWGGCGMVHPAVLSAGGADPARYAGFAFGMGLERTLMLRHGATNVRDFHDGDVRFTRAFGDLV